LHSINKQYKGIDVIKKSLIQLYELLYEKRRIARLRIKYRLRIMRPERTLRYIHKKKCSIARYGDGEFDLIFHKRNLGFQFDSEEIGKRLVAVLKNNNDSLLICIPRCYNTTKDCNDHSKEFWIEWGKNGHHEQIINLIRKAAGRDYLFGDSQITRPYIDWKTTKRAEKTFPMLKTLWKDRDIIIVEGEQTRLGVGNDLYSGAKSIKRILTPAVNAFDSYDKIKQAILDNYHGELIIMALGPTATILASDFADLGMQALDIGNIDIEYEWYLQKATERVAIEGKFTNEAKNGTGRVYTECDDPIYLSQIVARVNC